MIGSASPIAAQNSGRVAVVDHHRRIVTFRKLDDLIELGQVSVHGKHTIRGNHTQAAVLRFFQFRFQITYIRVGVTQSSGLTKPDSVDDAGMVKGITDNGVPFVPQDFKQPTVGIETGTIEDGVFCTEEPADGLFELFMQILCAANKPDGSHAIAMVLHPLDRYSNDVRMIGQPKVIVGAEIYDVALCNADVRTLGAENFPLGLIEPSRSDFRKLLGEGFREGGISHLISYTKGGGRWFLANLSSRAYHLLPFTETERPSRTVRN